MRGEDRREVPCYWSFRYRKGEKDVQRGQSENKLLSEFLEGPQLYADGLGTVRMARR